MAIDKAMLESWRPRALAVLRIVRAYLLIPHGTAKLFGVPHQSMFDGLQLVSLVGLAFASGGAWSVDAMRENWTAGPRPIQS